MTWTVGALLGRAREIGVARLDAQVLLAHHLQRPRSWVLAHDDAVLDAAAAASVQHALAERAAGVPLSYLTGEREFHGLVLKVDARVLVPRPETELLVDWALELLPPRTAAAAVDLGCGSGAIALAIAQARPRVTVSASDASAGALAVARANGAALGLGVNWLEGDWWAPHAGQHFDLALSNPPYIAAADAHLAALHAEPRQALTPGPSGLEAIEAIVAGAGAHLKHIGWLLLEHGHDQAAAVRALLCHHGFTAVETRRDLAGHERATGGCLGG